MGFLLQELPAPAGPSRHGEHAIAMRAQHHLQHFASGLVIVGDEYGSQSDSICRHGFLRLCDFELLEVPQRTGIGIFGARAGGRGEHKQVPARRKIKNENLQEGRRQFSPEPTALSSEV